MRSHPNPLSRLISAVIIASICSSVIQPAPAAADSPTAPSLQDGDPRRDYHDQTGKLRFLGAAPGEAIAVPGVLESGQVPEDQAMAILSVYGPEFGLSDPGQELRLMHSGVADGNRSITRYQQVYQGLPVLAGEMIVNTDLKGNLLSMSGEISPGPSLSVTPNITAEDARATALAAVAKWYGLTPPELTATDPELWVYDERLLKPGTRLVELVWRMDVRTVDAGQPIDELVLVNAHTGGLSLHFNQIDAEWSLNDAGPPTPTDTASATETPLPTELPTETPTETASATPAPTDTPTPVPTDTPTPTSTETAPATPIATDTPTDTASDVTTAGGDVVALAVTLYVKATGGSDSNNCLSPAAACATINGAIDKAANGDTIKVAIGTYTGTGTEVVLINKSVTLSGGWDTGTGFTTQSGMTTIDGQGTRRGITVNSGVTASVEHFTIQNGNATGNGGGIYNAGTLTITDSTISNNVAGSGHGSGIYNTNSGAFTRL